MKKLFIFAIAALGMFACTDKNAPSDPSNTEGLLPGVFSVSPTRKIQFSRGNLQYQANTATWRFAKEQYDVIGMANANINETYKGWIDLFGWGTGKYPTLATAQNSDYKSYSEWGKNIIYNGGNIANQWNTLSSEEWQYLFSGRTNADSLYGFGCIGGINGIILIPDLDSIPESLSFKAGGKKYTQNVYNNDQWTLMQGAGVVFLPAAGYRSGTTVHNSGLYGAYWSRSSNNENGAYSLVFTEGEVSPQCSDYRHTMRYYGKSVRLVQNAR